MSALDRYSYRLPSQLVATEPASPRDSAKLLVYRTDTDQVSFDTFRRLGDHLPEKSLLVFNDTKVLPARLPLKRATGGVVNALLLMNELQPKDRTIRAMVDRKVSLGEELTVGPYRFVAIGQDAHIFTLQPRFAMAELNDVADRYGRTPIPPYLKATTLPEAELRKKYQSIFAKNPASVAAPTASLHFTPRLAADLGRRGISRASITLHVGSGTFAPLTDENLRTRKLFKEFWELSPRSAGTIGAARKAGRPVVAVGTTATRALESALPHLPPTRGGIQGGESKGKMPAGQRGSTDLFIRPGYEFKTVDGLITNFHLPSSSLMYLVDAFLQHKRARRSILDLYALAIRNDFRFYSFGDGMVIL